MLSELARAWWHALQRTNKDRVLLARARNEQKVYEALAYYRLRKKLIEAEVEISHTQLVPAAWLGANVKSHGTGGPSAARKASLQRPGCASSTVSDVRMRRFLSTDDRWKMVLQLKNFLPLLKTVDVGLLMSDVVFWGPNARQRWAMDYFGNSPKL